MTYPTATVSDILTPELNPAFIKANAVISSHTPMADKTRELTFLLKAFNMPDVTVINNPAKNKITAITLNARSVRPGVT